MTSIIRPPAAGVHAARSGKRRTPWAAEVDQHIGRRIRLRRGLLGMSQTDLADKVGITFQQVQKYERGISRISASSLWKIGDVLDVPVAFFYDGLEAGSQETHQRVEISRWQLELCRTMESLPETLRHKIYLLARAVSDSARQSPSEGVQT